MLPPGAPAPPPPCFPFPPQPRPALGPKPVSTSAAIQPQGCCAFSTRVMPSHPVQPLSPWSPLALVLAKQVWVASSIFQKVLPILPSRYHLYILPILPCRYHLYTIALSPTSPPLCSSLLKTASWQRAPTPPTHFLGHLPSCFITGTQMALCVIAQSNVHFGSFRALWRHLFLPEIHAIESCLS